MTSQAQTEIVAKEYRESLEAMRACELRNTSDLPPTGQLNLDVAVMKARARWMAAERAYMALVQELANS